GRRAGVAGAAGRGGRVGRRRSADRRVSPGRRGGRAVDRRGRAGAGGRGGGGGRPAAGGVRRQRHHGGRRPPARPRRAGHGRGPRGRRLFRRRAGQHGVARRGVAVAAGDGEVADRLRGGGGRAGRPRPDAADAGGEGVRGLVLDGPADAGVGGGAAGGGGVAGGRGVA